MFQDQCFESRKRNIALIRFVTRFVSSFLLLSFLFWKQNEKKRTKERENIILADFFRNWQCRNIFSSNNNKKRKTDLIFHFDFLLRRHLMSAIHGQKSVLPKTPCRASPSVKPPTWRWTWNFPGEGEGEGEKRRQVHSMRSCERNQLSSRSASSCCPCREEREDGFQSYRHVCLSFFQ